MRFGILGPLSVQSDDGPVRLGGRKQRAVLAMLLIDANRVVSTDRLLDGVWGEQAGDRLPSLQVYISTLRKLLEPAAGAPQVLVTSPPGYRLQVDPDRVDALRFERLVVRGRKALAEDAYAESRALLGEALDLWRGPALADLADETFAAAEINRLVELRLAAVEDRIEADLALGRHADVVGELDGLVDEHPLRERFWAQLMIALYRAGRQADALRTYARARTLLVEEFGIDPGPLLREVERSVLAQDPQLAAPAAAAAPAARAALPAAANPLVGRAAELAVVLERLGRADVRLLTVTGPGGTGKTRLALEVATRRLGDLAGNVWFVRLDAVTDAALVPAAVAMALGAPGRAVGAADIAEAVGTRPGLLVLDNFEQVLAAAPFVRELLDATQQLTVLVTSRACLRVSGEHEHPLPPLELPPADHLPESEADARGYGAIELFVARTEAVCPNFRLAESLGVVSRICRRLDGLPLALELAAGRMKILTPTRMLERLERSLELLSDGAHDLPDRQRTLRATLEWSHGLLDGAEQALLARLAVFAGGFTLEAAEAVCGLDGESVVCGLATLVDNSLVRAAGGGARFSMLETIWTYAAERLDTSGERDELRRRHLGYFLELAESAGDRLDRSDGALQQHRLESEVANLGAALGYAVEVGETELAGRLAVALHPWWLAQGRLVEGLGWLDTVLADPDLPEVLRAEATVAAGVLVYNLDDWDAARERLQLGRERAQATGRRCAEAVALCLLGAVAAVQGAPGEARERAEEALALVADGSPAGPAPRSSPRAGIARAGSPRAGSPRAGSAVLAEDVYRPRVMALAVLALAAAVQGDAVTERARYLERLAMVRRRGDRLRTADTLNNLAEIALEDGDTAEARARGLEALEFARTNGTMQTRDTLITLARAALAEREPDAATTFLHEAVSLSVSLRQSFGMAQGLRALASAAQCQGDPQRAVVLFAAAERIHPALRGDDGARERDIDAALENARAELGEPAYDEAWRSGGCLAPDEVIAYALGEAAARRLLAG